MKRIWRKIFKEYFIGDRIRLLDYGSGKIVEKELIGDTYLYTIKLDKPYEVDAYLRDDDGNIIFTGKIDKIEEFGDLKFEDLEEC